MKILIAGEGGQGIQTAAQVLAKAAFKEGKRALYIPNFGVENEAELQLLLLFLMKTRFTRNLIMLMFWCFFPQKQKKE